MNARDRINKMKAIKEAYEAKKAELVRAQKMLEQENPLSMCMLIENDLEQAKLILAAKDVLDRLQKIAEHLAELGAEEIMPLADNMKGAFGPDIAAEFEHTANDAIQRSLETVRNAKDTIDSAILKVEGKIPPGNDMSSDTGTDAQDAGTLDTDNMSDIGPDDVNAAVDAAGTTDDSSDDFSGADAAGAADPMGRAKKESTNNNKNILESIGRQVLVKESLKSLFAWLLEDATARIKDADALNNFAKVAVMKANENPEKMAGWIAQKKYGPATIAQMAKPQISNSAAESGLDITIEAKKEKLARGIAKVIEANVESFGQGYAARVIEQFIGDDASGLMENADSRTSVLETFEQIFGMSPGRYSLSLKKSLGEAGQSIPTPPTPPKAPAAPGSSTLSPQQKQKANNAISKLASQVANNPSAGGDSVSNATSSFDPEDQEAIRDLESNISANNGGDTSNVDDLLKASGKALGEAGRKPKRKSYNYTPDDAGYVAAQAARADQQFRDDEQNRNKKQSDADYLNNFFKSNMFKSRPTNEAGPSGLEMGSGGKSGKPMQTDAGLNKAKTGTPKGSPTKKSPSKMQKGSSTPFAQMKGGRNVTKEEIEEIEENINAALWPTDPKTGQYKGEPMSTDYGKLKSKTKDNDNTKVADSDSSMPGTKKDTSAKKVSQGKSPETVKKNKTRAKLPKDNGNSPGDSENDDSNDSDAQAASGNSF